MKRIIIFGATSAIAQAAARRWVAQGPSSFFLVGRDADRLAAQSADLLVRGAARAEHSVLDINHLEQHAGCLHAAIIALGGVDIVLVAHGTLGDQKASESDFAEALRQIHTNAISVLSLLTIAADVLERQGRGALVVIGSVAGDRGRKSNYVYGTAKAAVSTFSQGLRHRLSKSGVRVVTVKPGFVDTPMTAHFRKGVLWATPDAVAAILCRAAERGGEVVYAPAFWRFIMLAVKMIPERLFRRLNL